MFTYFPNGQPYLTIDVSNNTVSSHAGYFRNITIGGKTLDGGTVEQLTNLNSSVGQLTVDLNELESTVNTIITQIHPYVNTSTYDMTTFFMAGSTDEEPVIMGATVETLIFEQPYRTQAGIVIPLYMGTCQVGDRLCSMVYHDHLNADGRIERIYVPVETGVDGNSIMRAGNPGIITFQSVTPAQRNK